jgi:hypothetical protein
LAVENIEIVNKPVIQALFLLLKDMLPHMSPSALALPLGEPGSEPKRPFIFATSFYGVPPCRTLPPAVRKPQPAATASEDLSKFILSSSKVKEASKNLTPSSKAISTAAGLLTDLLSKVSEKQKSRIAIQWEVDAWRDAVLDYMEQVRT